MKLLKAPAKRASNPFTVYETALARLREFEEKNEVVMDQYRMLRDKVEEKEAQAKDYARTVIPTNKDGTPVKGTHTVHTGQFMTIEVQARYESDSYNLALFRKRAGKMASACIQVVKEKLDESYVMNSANNTLKQAMLDSRVPGIPMMPAVSFKPI